MRSRGILRISGFVVIAMTIAVVSLTAAKPATAYLVFTDRDNWSMAVSGFSQSVENFDGIADGQYPAGTLPSTVFTNLETVPLFPLPTAISGGTVVPPGGRGFSVWMEFPKPVVGVGLDIVNPQRTIFQIGLSELPFAGAFLFQRGMPLPEPDFLGWVAEPGDAALRQTFVFFDPDSREEFGWDNLRVAEIPIPGAFALFVCALAALAGVGFGKQRNRS